MGFDRATIQILLTAREAGASFDRVLTIGRQWVYITEEELRELLSRNGIQLSANEVRKIYTDQKGYCEPLLNLLGASQIDSIDISGYEDASILHDMNRPLPETYRDQFSIVIDGGSLEHVFDFPAALKNCMQAVAPGGHFIGITPANNFMGHGFYQLSPELFFRVFVPANGFKIINIIIYEYPWKSVWYEVVDPVQAQSRVELTNSRPTLLIVWAKKTASVPIFEQPPQQSDYLATWHQSARSAIGGADAPPRSTASFFKRFAPQLVARLYRAVRPFRPTMYKRRADV